MADIKQAAKWLQEGKRVCRTGWKQESRHPKLPRIVLNNGQIATFNCNSDVQPSSRPSFTLNDLLAEDWEIAE